MAAAVLFCGGAAAGAETVTAPVPLPRPRPVLTEAGWIAPHSFREAAGPDFDTTEVTSAPSECRLRLEKIALLEPLPRLIGPGACGGRDMVRISGVFIPGKPAIEIKPAPALRCAMAEQLALWIRDDAAPQIAKLGTPLRTVEPNDDYNCRGRNNIFGAMMSEHGKGNAVDIFTFHLIDAKTISPTDIRASKPLREALKASACARFSTVLGPSSDGYHEEHIHFDLADRRGNYRVCQWAVREPPPPKTEAEMAAAAPFAAKPVPSAGAAAAIAAKTRYPARPKGIKF